MFEKIINIFNPNKKCELGPNNIHPFILSDSLQKLINLHNEYINSLNKWKQYLIWRYTMGSGQINKMLIGINDKESTIFWTYQFFLYYKNHDINIIDEPYKKYLKYFKSPKSFLKKQDYQLALDVMEQFIIDIQFIIYDSPPVPEDVLVFKASTKYFDIPEQEKDKELNLEIPQKPFNSTSYDPQYNYNNFMSPDSSCCLWELKIPSGSQVLCISQLIHAYPDEMEILIPFGSYFILKNIKDICLSYYPKEKKPYIKIQSGNPYYHTNVWRQDPSLSPKILSKNVKLLQGEIDTTFHNELFTSNKDNDI